MSNNLYNILAAFQNATKPEEVETPKQQAQKIYESVEAKGSIMGGVKGVEKKLAEAFAKHKVEEGSKPTKTEYSKKLDQSRKDNEDLRKQGVYGSPGSMKKVDWVKKGDKKVEEGKMSDLDYELKAKEVSDADFKKKYGKSKADMKKSMSGKKDEKKKVDEADVYEPWYDEKDAGSSTTNTDTGRIHRAGRGGYGNQTDDEAPIAMPAGQVARGRGRPKNLAGELKRKAAADRLAANGGVKMGRGRPRKNPAGAGAPDSAPQGTLGLHRFLFGPMPTSDTLPGKKGAVHKIKTAADSDEFAGESIRTRKAPIAEAKANLKAYLSESFQNPGSDAFDHILHRFKNEVKRFQAGEDMDNDLYDALFDYYCNSGEMPYGIAKARSGDPYEWVAARFDQDYPAMGEAVNPVDIPAVQRKAQGQAPLSLDQVRAPRADSISDKRNLAQANGTKDLDDLARLAGITTESVSVIGGHNEEEMMGDSSQEDKMNISTNQSSDGTKSITVTADGEAAVALLDMLKNAGMGASDAAAQQEVIIATQGDEHMGDDMAVVDSGVEMEEEYANEPAPAYQSVEKQMSAGDDMNREKKQNFPLRAPGSNPMSEMSIDPGKSMGRDLMAEYQAMKLQK